MKQQLIHIYKTDKWRIEFYLRRSRLYWRHYDRQFGWLWRATNVASAALLFGGLVAIPVLSNLWQQNSYRLDADTMKLVGQTDTSLADQLTYDPTTQTYQFNKAGLQQSASPLDPNSALMKAQAGSSNSSLYALELPQDLNKGVTYHDTNTGLSFTLTPDFMSSQGKEEQGHVVYPLDQGDQAIYTLKGNGLKEDIVVPRAFTDEMIFNYTFNLPATLEAKLIPGTTEVGIYSADPSLYGNISYGTTADQERVMKARINSPKNHLVFGLPAPVIKDMNGVAAKAVAKFELKGNTLSVVATNLGSIQGSFTIDPSVVITSSSDFATGNNEGNIDFGTAGQINRGGLTGGSMSGGWQTPTSSTYVSSGQGAGVNSVAYNGYLYVFGGKTTVTRYAPLTSGAIGTWNTTSSALGRQYSGAAAYDGYLYALGGYNSGAFATVSYAKINSDGTVNAWATTTSLPTARHSMGAAAYNGYLYSIGGGTSTSNLYADVLFAPINADGTIGAWHYTHNSTDDGVTFVAGLPSARWGASSVAYNGYIYAMGGEASGPTELADVLYAKLNNDGTVGAWQTTTSLPIARQSTAATVYNGYLYVLGGQNGSGTNYADVYYATIYANGDVGPWQSTSNLPAARYSLGVATYAGYMYEIGGDDGTTSGAGYLDVHYAQIDPAGVTGSYSTTTSLPVGLKEGSSVAYNGYVYQLGGVNASGTIIATTYYAPINSDGTLGTWTTTTSLPVANWGGSAVAYNGYIYEISGAQTSNTYYAPLNSNGTIGTWATTTSIGATTYLGAAAAYDGYMYQLGGYSGAYLLTTRYAAISGNGTLGTWTTTTSLPVQSQEFGCVIYNGYIYKVGGRTGSIQNSVYYASLNSNGTIGTWTATSSLPTATYGATTVVNNGYIYNIGGYTTARTAEVDYAQLNSDGTLGTWTTTVSLPTATYHATAAAYDGYIYQMGGDTAGSGITTVDYAPINNGGRGTTGAWTTNTTSFTTARDEFRSLAYNGYLYVLGGYEASSPYYLNTVQYAPINTDGSIGTWLTTSSFTTGRFDFSAAIYNGYMYILGGSKSDQTAASSYVNDVQYALINSNGTLGTWQTTTSFMTARFGQASAAYNGYLYIIGGSNEYDGGPGNRGGGPLNDVQYAPINSNGTLGTWHYTHNSTDDSSTFVSGFTNGRYDFGTAINNGYIYILGGNEYIGGLTLQVDVQYAPLNSNGTIGTWQATTSLTHTIMGQASLVYNGYLYQLGGTTGSVQNTVQYAPFNANGTLGAWQTTSSFTTARYRLGAVAYQGRAYILGGSGSGFLNDVQYAPLQSIARIGHYSKFIDLGALATLETINYNGVIPEVDGVEKVNFRAAGTSGVFGSLTAASTLSGNGCSSVGGVSAQYVLISVTLDDSYGAIFSDSAGTNANLTDVTANYHVGIHPLTSLRLRGGQTLQNGSLSSLDTCS